MRFLCRLACFVLFVFFTHSAVCKTQYVTRSKKYYDPKKAKNYIKEANKYKADADKAAKAGNAKLAEALTKIYECKLRIAEGYDKGDRSKIRVGVKTCEDAIEEYKKLQKTTSPEVLKAEAREDAKDFIKSAKYRKYANTSYSIAVKFKRKGKTELANKMLNRAKIYLKLSNAYKTGDIAAIEECEIALGHKKPETKQK